MPRIDGLAGLFASGHTIDAIAGLVCVEAAGLWLCRRLAGRGPGLRPVAATLLAGLCLVIALRLALADGWWGWIALALSGSLLAHLFDLRGRWRA
ncbi:MAG TPA: hypothetical protein VJ779_09760 [Acetobacteraceae bacterium]|nr:hypothetical protein [Acetobacteraceae bacterium]